MTTELPPAVLSAAEHVSSPPEPTTAAPDDITGELRALLSWWLAVSDGTTPHERVLTPEPDDLVDAATAMQAGVAALDRAVDSGATVVVPRVTSRDDDAARAVVAVLTRSDSPALVPQPQGMSDAAWMTKVARIRDDAFRLSAERADPVALLDGVGASAMAYVVGVLLAGAARRTPSIIDGTDELAAALVADRISHTAKAWWICGSQSSDPARAAAADRIDLAAGLPLALVDDSGRGADATLTLLRMLLT